MALALTSAVSAHEPLPLRVEQRAALRDLPPPVSATHTLELRAINLDEWPEPDIRSAMHTAASILSQCGIHTIRVDMLQVSAPETHRYFDTPRSRELARALNLPRPAVFFTAALFGSSLVLGDAPDEFEVSFGTKKSLGMKLDEHLKVRSRSKCVE